MTTTTGRWALAAILLCPTVAAQETADIHFEPGSSGTTIDGSITGQEYVDYVLRARGGQRMTVDLEVTGTDGHGSAFFNILPAGKDYGGPYVGSADDDRSADVVVPADGAWAIRVYLLGNDKDAGRRVDYSIDVSIE